MSRRPRTANSVSLFPFLAVLVCAMGALILLLIVTTRRIRSDAMSKARGVAQTPKPAPKVRPVKGPPEKRTPVKKPPARAVVSAKPDRPLPPQTVQIPDKRWHSLTVPTRVNPNPALRRTLARLEAARNQQSELSDEAINRFRAAEREALALRQSVEDSATKKRNAEQRIVSLKSETDKSTDEIQNTVAEMDRLRRQILRKREDYARASSEFSIVPFEGDTGTTRRPIFIECTDKVLRFLPEGIALTANDLRGFSAEYNPLLTGARSLIDYWNAKHRQPGNEPKPYVMLLVRPSGTTTFYIARKLLQKLGHPIGYELVDDGMKLALPDADPKAQVVCQVGVRRAFGERHKLVQSLAGGTEPTETGGRKLRFHRGTGRLEVIEPDRSGDSTTSGGRGFGRSRSKDPWRNVLNGGSAPRRTAQNQQRRTGSGTANATTDGFNRDTDFNRQPGHFGGSRPTGRGTAGTGRGQFAGGNPAGGRNENTPRGRDAGTSTARRTRRGSANDTREAGAPNERGDPTSPNGLANGVANGTGSGSSKNRGGEKPAGAQSGRRFAATNGATARSDGQQFGGTGTAASTQPGKTSQSPSMSLGKFGSSRPTRRRAKKRWGFFDAAATIGFEREVTVQTAADRFIVGDRHVIRIGKGEPTRHLMQKVIAAVESEARSWGKPPRSFYWVPMLKFVISPGGNQHYQRLRGEVHNIGLQSTVEYKLVTPNTPARSVPTDRGSN